MVNPSLRIPRYLCIAVIGLLCFALAAMPVSALKNPAAVYCSALGYQPVAQTDASGGQASMCRMPDGQVIDAWKFLQGKVSPENSYCARQGLAQKTVTNSMTCFPFGIPTCAVCVQKDGTEVEVTKLMNLSFDETTCGDGSCGFPENFQSCPADCLPSGPDDVCQKAVDLKCDPDCTGSNGDMDCLYLGIPQVTVLAIIVVIGAGLGVWYLLRKRKSK